MSAGNMSSSRTCDITLSGKGSQGQQEALKKQPQHKSQSRKFISTDVRESNRRPKLGQHRKWLVVQRALQARRMSHPAQKKESAGSLQSKSQQLILRKGHVSSENHFRERIKQWIFPNKAKDQNSPLQKGKPAADTAQSQGTGKRSLIMDVKTVESQALMIAVRQILGKMKLHCRLPLQSFIGTKQNSRTHRFSSLLP